MKSGEVRRRYIEFFKARGHVEIPSAPLVPENDPTTLFTGSGMQPMIPYLLGQEHPEGSRLVDSQKCFRAQDIEEVGDNRHTTFFEMLGNWSLGDYFKKDQIEWIFDFLTNAEIGLGLDPKRLFVSVFKGEPKYHIPRDEEAAELWIAMFARVGIDAKAVDDAEKQGMQDGRIFYYDEKKNWWSRASSLDAMPLGEPGGPDSEVFYDFGADRKLHESSVYKDEPCHVNCDCGRFLEICNSVFMTYKKTEKGFEPLVKKNIDFGGGLERMVAASENDPDIFKTDIFSGAKKILEDVNLAGKIKNIRIILDHIRAAMFIIDAGVEPSNKDRGYVLRRLIRRSAVHAKIANIDLTANLNLVLGEFGNVYAATYPSVSKNRGHIHEIISEELTKFDKTLENGIKMIGKASSFDLYQTYGFPAEIIEDLFKQKGLTFNKEEFEKELRKHQSLSRTASKGMFAGGLADKSEKTINLHTAHHLLLAALQKVVDPAIRQRGSNITAERLRMDFNFTQKITPEELKKVEELVNNKISENLPVTRVEMSRGDAEKIGAQMEFGHKYPDRVSVYFIGPQKEFFSAEFCGGPHVGFTGQLGRFTIVKEEGAGSGIRRIYATLTRHHEATRRTQSISS